MLPIIIDICQPPSFNNCVALTVVDNSDKPKDKESGGDVPHRGGSRRDKSDKEKPKCVDTPARGCSRREYRIENSDFTFYYKPIA